MPQTYNHTLSPGDQQSGLPIRGYTRHVISADAATLTLLPRQSSAIVELNRAAGTAVTLPASSSCQAGTFFEFVVGVTLTGDCTIAAAGSDVLSGLVVTSADGAAGGSDAAGATITIDQSASAVKGNQVVVTKGSGDTWHFRAFSPAAVGITVA